MFPTVYKTVQPVKDVLEASTQETSSGIEAIWLLDTLTLAAIPASYMGGVLVAARFACIELEQTRLIQQNGRNGYHAKPQLRPIRLEHYLVCDEYIQTANTEQTMVCQAEKSQSRDFDPQEGILHLTAMARSVGSAHVMSKTWTIAK